MVGFLLLVCITFDNIILYLNFLIQAQALKLNKESREHKQKIIFYTSLKGIRIVDEKTQVSLCLATGTNTVSWVSSGCHLVKIGSL